MSRLFISHSSWNNDKAKEVVDWLANNGWDDVFLDLDPVRGIAAGQRWKEALQKAAWRCEVVLALVSKEWLASSWCKSEVDAARMMGKKVIAALVGIDKSEVPPDLTDEQYVDLTGDPDAYLRLKEGLKRAGLDPTTFPFPAGRRPYPGFAYLEEQDAAVFFSRDAQIVRGLDEIRRLARTGVSRMFVILGASGSGKSSFLRAGLWPRLKRDDRAWLPLPVIRPERAGISGKYGLAQALYEIISEPRFAEGMRRRGLPRSRADIQDFIGKADDGLAQLLETLREIARPGDNASALTTLLAVDQSEELFNEDGQDEAKRFIEILTRTLTADPRTLTILVMRSDSVPLLQRDPNLAALPKDAFTLDMMLQGSYRAVIEGPARLLESPLKIDPELVDALLKDISGQDALPLLAFTLAHLYDNYRAENELTLSGYDKIGRVTGVIDKTVSQAFADAVARGEAPEDGKAQLALARSAFIPHLARVDAAGQFVRRVAPRDKIPAEARPLIDRFAEQRLLTKDRRKDADGKDVDVLEVAHEALLRQPPFSEWLAEDSEFLTWRDRLSQARAAFAADQRGLLAGRELAIARSYLQSRAERDFEPADLAYMRDSINADESRRAKDEEKEHRRLAAEKEEQERRIRDAERIAEEERKAAAEQKRAADARKRTAQVSVVGLVAALVVAAAAVWQYFAADEAKKDAVTQQKAATQAREAAEFAKKEALSQRDRAVGAEGAAKEATASARASADEARARLRDSQISQSRLLANLAHQNRAAGDAGTAVAIALEALPDNAAGSSRPYVPDAELQLSGALRDLHEQRVLDYGGKLRKVVASPDGRRILTYSEDGSAQLWDVATSRTIGAPLEGAVSSAAFSPDGKRLVSYTDKITWIWDAETGRKIGAPLPAEESLYTAAFSPDGKRIVTASDDYTAQIWDPETGQRIGSPLEGAISDAAFNPEGQIIITASYDGARLWNASGSPVGRLQDAGGYGDKAPSAGFSPDGTHIFTTSGDGTARLWDAKTHRAVWNLLGDGQRDAVVFSAFSPNGMRIVTVFEDKTKRSDSPLVDYEGSTPRLWDASREGDLVSELRGHIQGVSSTAFSPDNSLIVTTSFDHTARLWDAATGSQTAVLGGHTDSVTDAAFSPDGKSIFTVSGDGTMRIWNAKLASDSKALGGYQWGLTSAAFTGVSDKDALACNEVLVWDANTGEPIGEPIKGHGEEVLDAAFSDDGKRILTVTKYKDRTVQLWDVTNNRALGDPLRGHDWSVRATLSPDGKRIATASGDGTAEIWDAKTGQPIGEVLRGHNKVVGRVVFSHDGKRIVTASADKTARLWDGETGQPLGEPLKGHEEEVLDAAFSVDGKRVVTASKDGTTRLWDATSGRPIAEPLREDDRPVRPVTSASFSPDGKQIVVAIDTPESPLRIWYISADTAALVARAKEAVARCLTPRQRTDDLFLRSEPPAWCIELEKWPYNTPAWKQWLADVRAGKNPPVPTGP
jgi:WD40 repeat protein